MEKVITVHGLNVTVMVSDVSGQIEVKTEEKMNVWKSIW